MLIVDGHQDLAWNMLALGRDYTLAAAETRQHEQGSLAVQVNGDTLLGWSDYQRGQVAIIFSTLFTAPANAKLGDWDKLTYETPDQAHKQSMNQLDAYHRLVEGHPDMFRLLHTRDDMRVIIEHWNRKDTDQHPVGLVVLMENAEGVRQPAELEEWWQRGVRIIGPAWTGTRFCGGTRQPGPLTPDGYALLERMAEIGFTLDLSHMDETAALQALDSYQGAIIASHANALALLKNTDSNRHLSDRLIRGLIERGGTIGIVPANSFLRPGWKDSGGRASVTLDLVAGQIDYVCQLAGNAQHAAIGSDFDGGFGLQSVPSDIDTIADLQKLAPLLAIKGYSEADIAAILAGNWLAHLERHLPEGI